MRSFALALLLALISAPPARAGSTHVAVAANFTDTATTIAAAFKAATGHEAVLSFGASGALFMQITQGAPYEILLSADQDWPRQAVEAGLALEETRFTYAIGALVLWSRDGRATLGDAALRSGSFRKLAIANPASAPYGQAALETLAVVAYRQPVSRARISAVRGVNVDGVVRTLTSRGLVAEAGHDQSTGAILYRTTELFLERLGLRSLEELPPVADYLPDIELLDEFIEQTSS